MKQVSPGKGWTHREFLVFSRRTPGRQGHTGSCLLLLCPRSREWNSSPGSWKRVTKLLCAGGINTTHIVPVSVFFCSEMQNSTQKCCLKAFAGYYIKKKGALPLNKTGSETSHHSFDAGRLLCYQITQGIVQIGLEIPCAHSETELPKCFSYMNCVTPRLYYTQITPLLTPKQIRKSISDNAVQEQTRNKTHNCYKYRPGAGWLRSEFHQQKTAVPPLKSIKPHQHKINSVTFDLYRRNSIDFNGVGVTPILCWCICISVSEVMPAWLM